MDDHRNEHIRLNPDTIFVPTPTYSEKDETYDNEDNEPSTSTRRTLIDSHLFQIGRDDKTEANFKNERVKGWIHGVKPPYTVLKYRKLKRESANNIFSKSNQQEIFSPQVVCEPIDHESLKLKGTSTSSDASIHNKSVSEREMSTKNETGSGFSGYFSIPKTSLNIPNWYRLDKQRTKRISELPQICYQNHVDLGEVTYTFGGLYVNKYSNFKHLGIPIDVDPEKISIEFPCELPPHINKNILISPYMMQNPHLVLLNSFRNTVSYCDTSSSGIFPGHLNFMSSCQISKKHVFFCGGFETKVESVEYLSDIDRWVIKKNLVMNEFGYILDVRTLKFSRILLQTKDDSLSLARIGYAITSNLYEPPGVNHEVPDRCLSPPIFADTSSEDNTIFQASASSKPLSSPLPNHPNIRKIPQSSSSDSSGTKVLGNSPEQTNEPESTTPASATSSYSFNASITSGSMKNLDQSEFSRATPSMSSIKPTTSQNSSGQKFTNVLSKSTKIFHRHQKQPSNGNPKSPSHILTNTYSKQVRDNRSNSQNGSSESPALSGGPSQKPSSTKTNTGNNKDNTTEGTTNQYYNEHKKDNDVMLENQDKPSNSLNPSIASIDAQTTNQSSANFDSKSAKSFENDYVFSEKNKECISNSDTEFVSVSIYIFGGFVCNKDEDGFQRFKASNDFYRIDLISQNASYAIRFQEDAVVQRVGVSKTSRNDNPESLDTFPTPRGYFAFSLIDRSQTIDDNCCLGRSSAKVSSAKEPPKEPVHLEVNDFYTGKYSKTAFPASDNTSTNSTSIATTSSRSTSGVPTEHKTPDDFFIGKSLLIQGGCNEISDTFSDFYLFVFETGKWQTLSTYVHEYFNASIQPFEDDDSNFFDKENEIQNPRLIEAELRSCHHTALYYKNEEKDYLFFVGGLYNDYLRFQDKEPYYSDKFDISRLSKFQFIGNNKNVLRISVLNLQTQTWRFLKYFYDLNHISDSKFFERLHENPSWNNARLSNFGGSISLNGKRINICHGLAVAIPEKKEDIENLRKDVPRSSLLFGAHVSITFPSL